ncbi:protein TonB [Flavobacteriaceae bacterium MAR_2010_188]|nr:protein TonB [Flavobacteriaceae bacterium MAR_2010_188]
MKNLNKTPKNADQSVFPVSKSQKHEVNLRTNSTLYFQVGLILCLLGVYSLLEMNFKNATIAYENVDWTETTEPSLATNFVIEKTKEKPKEVQKQVIFQGQKLEVVIDNTPDALITEFMNPETTSAPLEIESIEVIDEPEEIDEPFNMINVEKVPIYPGCESSTNNEERRKCMSEKLATLIQKQFNSDAGYGSGLIGIQKISVQFTIDKSGKVQDIITRAPTKNLEKEAKRVIELIPNMQPAKQRERAVRLIYQLPIVFKVQD